MRCPLNFFLIFVSNRTQCTPIQTGQTAQPDPPDMPQHHTPHGTFSYPDAKSGFPELPRVVLGRAVAIGIGAGFMGALVYVPSTQPTLPLPSNSFPPPPA